MRYKPPMGRIEDQERCIEDELPFFFSLVRTGRSPHPPQEKWRRLIEEWGWGCPNPYDIDWYAEAGIHEMAWLIELKVTQLLD